MFELTECWERLREYYKAHRVKTIVLYLLLIFYSAIPVFQVPFLDFHTIRVSSLMDQRILENFFLYYPSQSSVALADVSPVLLKSIVAMEDDAFFIHRGIDWNQLELSMQGNKRGSRRKRGGSTISMQLVKNAYFTTNRSVIRKVKELMVTARMEKEVSKAGILRNYVNIVEWGEGIFGAEKAADIYFNTTAAKLNVNQATRLAAVIPAPLRYKPNENSRYVMRRSSIIRGRYNSVLLFPEK